jgi:hypothetical protein
MIFVITNYGVHRNQAGREWKEKAAVFALAAVLAGVGVGASLGALGSLVSSSVRAAVVTLLSLAGLVLGALDLTPKARKPLQFDRETAQRWMNRGALTGAAMNGAALGSGFFTRLGYWLWFVLPVCCFLSASPSTGAVVLGSYGLVRGLIPAAVIAHRAVVGSATEDVGVLEEWLLSQKVRARTVAGLSLVALSTVGVLLAG